MSQGSVILTGDSISMDECGILKMPCFTRTQTHAVGSFPRRDQRDCPGGSRPQQHRHPHLESAAFRLQTFESWPVTLHPRPQALVEAGFFYLGMGDRCVCFSCGNGLRDWAVTDDPWIEHKKHFPSCQFVIEEAAKGRKPNKETLSLTLEPIDTKIPEALLCKICYSRRMCVTFLPCKHVPSCESCASCLKKCPICQGKIEGSFKVYL